MQAWGLGTFEYYLFFFILQSKVEMRGVENLAFGEIFLDWSVQDRFKRVRETKLEGWCTGRVSPAHTCLFMATG